MSIIHPLVCIYSYLNLVPVCILMSRSLNFNLHMTVSLKILSLIRSDLKQKEFDYNLFIVMAFK